MHINYSILYALLDFFFHYVITQGLLIALGR